MGHWSAAIAAKDSLALHVLSAKRGRRRNCLILKVKRWISDFQSYCVSLYRYFLASNTCQPCISGRWSITLVALSLCILLLVGGLVWCQRMSSQNVDLAEEVFKVMDPSADATISTLSSSTRTLGRDENHERRERLNNTLRNLVSFLKIAISFFQIITCQYRPCTLVSGQT